jgi:hypothetical protein
VSAGSRRGLALTSTAISSSRLSWDNARYVPGGLFEIRGIKIPVAVSAFPDVLNFWALWVFAQEMGTHFLTRFRPSAHDRRSTG